MTGNFTVYFAFLSFFVYGFLGWCTEVAFAAFKERRFVNRGFLNGPICPIYGVGVTMVIWCLDPVRENLLILYVASVILVTVLEGLTGYAMDKIFHNKWWDYSNMPMNIGGYVCVLFSLIWGVACVAIVDVIHPIIFKGLEWIPYIVGVVLIVILMFTLCADLYVTASGIIKMNRRLERMEKIAGELHEISDQLGEEIYKGVIVALEKQEESKKKVEESKKKMEEAAQSLEDALKEKTAAAAELGDGLKEKIERIREEGGQRTGEMLTRIREEGPQKPGEMLERIRTEGSQVTEEMIARIAGLKQKYREAGKLELFSNRRLLKAFPKLESHDYKDQLEELKRQLEKLSENEK